MKRKNIILSTIALMFSICLFVFGVYSATNPTVGITGQVSFTLSNSSVLVRGKVNGQATDSTASTQQAVADFPAVHATDYSQSTKVPAVANAVSQTYLDYTTPDTDYTSNPNGIATWNVGDLYFYENSQGVQDIVIEVELTNYSFYPVEISVETFEIADNNVTYTAPNGTTAHLSENGGKQVLKFVLNVQNTNQAVTDAGINLGMKIEQAEVVDQVKQETVEGWSARQDDTLGGLVLTNYNGPDTEIVIPSKLKISQLENASDFATSQANSKLAGLNLSQYESEQEIDVVGVEGNMETGEMCFNNFKDITSVYVSSSIKQIGAGAFVYLGCQNLEEYMASEGTITAEYNKVEITFEENSQLTTIGFSAFSMSGITSIEIPNSVTEIGEGAFYGCYNLQSISIPNSVTEIGGACFSQCRLLQTVVIPNGVTEIGEQAFYLCDSLQSVVIGNSVQTIGDEAFFECYKLIEVTNLSPHITLTLGADRYDNGGVAQYAKHIRTSLTDPEYWYVDSNGIGWYEDNSNQEYYLVKYNYGNQTEITLPNLTPNGKNYALNDYLFAGTDITKVVIPDTVTSMGKYAFQSCKSLETVEIGNGVTEIGEWAFYYCDSLQMITIPDNVITIENFTFVFCHSLQSVVIGNGVQTIEREAFNSCDALQSVYYKDTQAEKEAKLTISVGNSTLKNATWYYYNENTNETASGNYWYYDNGEIKTFTV